MHEIPTASAPRPSSSPVAAGLEGVVVADTRLSHVDGERGHLLIAGHPLESLAREHDFEDVCGFMLHEPGAAPIDGRALRATLGAARERADSWLRTRPELLGTSDALRALARALACYELSAPAGAGLSPLTRQALEMLGLLGVATAHWVRQAHHQPWLTPDPDAAHAHDLLRLASGAAPNATQAGAFDDYLVTVSDHGLNASTFTARVVASTGSELPLAALAALGALSGPLHGGAPGPVLDMFDAVGSAERARAWLRAELARGRRIMGMGHRVYRVRDPRARVLAGAVRGLATEHPELSQRLALARAVEHEAEALLAERHPERPLRANVEFFTALLLDALGFPRRAFSAVFASARALGWCAHYQEQQRHGRLIRPSSRYIGPLPPLPRAPIPHETTQTPEHARFRQGMTYAGGMNADEARTRLRQRERELQSQLDSFSAGAAPVELDQSSVGRLSRMDAMQQQTMAAESQRRRRAELSQVRAALSRIEAGEWGDCLECGEPIAAKRLEHDPAAVLCIDCARR